jgi:outer membrane lipoprotein-sorting protein
MPRFPEVSDRASASMRSKAAALLCILCCLCSTHELAAADVKKAAGNLTAAQIVERNVAARGGLQAWRAIQTMSVSGQMEAGSGDSAMRSIKLAREGVGATVKKHTVETSPGADQAQPTQVQLPFALEMKRPHKSRLEIEFSGKKAVQVYDGTNGWKYRPYLNRNDVEPFTAEEAKAAQGKGDFEGPLVDYVAKGTAVQFEAMDPVEGHDAYKLKLTMKNGDVQHIWIDAQSFLDVKLEGIPRRMDGRLHTVWIYQREFRSVQGLMIPFVLETAVEGYHETHKTIIEKVTLNQKLDDAAFGKPSA